MSRLWMSRDGGVVINFDHVTHAFVRGDGAVGVCIAGLSGPLVVHDDDAKSFWASFLATAIPMPSTSKLDVLTSKLDRLRGDMASVGGNALVEIVRDLVSTLKAVAS